MSICKRYVIICRIFRLIFSKKFQPAFEGTIFNKKGWVGAANTACRNMDKQTLTRRIAGFKFLTPGLCEFPVDLDPLNKDLLGYRKESVQPRQSLVGIACRKDVEVEPFVLFSSIIILTRLV